VVVTISAPFGAGGAYVGPRLADRLGVPFVDRAIPNEVARRLSVPLDDAVANDESAGSVLDRFVRIMAPAGMAFGARPIMENELIDQHTYRDTTERVIRELAAGEGGVFLGRAAALVLRDTPGALHVRLYGPVERRVARAMEADDLSRDEAIRQLKENDRARETYVRHFYGADPGSLEHYHLAIDSTAIPLDRCVELIAAAAAR
jgi:cytidylate kinase